MSELPIALDVLHGEGVLLRRVRDDDAPALAEAFASDIATTNPSTAADVAEWISGRREATPTKTSWIIEFDGIDLAGQISLFFIDSAQLNAEVGYWVVPAARRRGVATRALNTVAECAFTTIGLHRIQLYHSISNVASCGVAQAAGFRHEGDLRQSYRYPDGQFHDEHLHARLATD